jgi:uncharacterized protein (DUF983 family)
MQLLEPMGCPNCEKKGFVQRGDSLYRCVYCGFQRNLSEPHHEPDTMLTFMIAVAITGLVAASLWSQKIDRRNSQPLRSQQEIILKSRILT